jgi:predicted O-methyltransferase YrrM
MIENFFTRVANIVAKTQGWRETVEAQQFAVLTLALQPRLIVEIGVFGGRSFIPMAMALKHCGCGRIVGIDPWDARFSKLGQIKPEDVKYWEAIDHDAVYKHFMGLLKESGASDCCEIIRKPSDEVPTLKLTPIDLLSIDGNHGEQAFRDTERFSSNVRVGGIIVLDDLGWSGNHVRKAEQHIIERGFVMLYKLGSGAVYQRCS